MKELWSSRRPIAVTWQDSVYVCNILRRMTEDCHILGPTSCSLLEIHWRSGRTCCLQLQATFIFICYMCYCLKEGPYSMELINLTVMKCVRGLYRTGKKRSDYDVRACTIITSLGRTGDSHEKYSIEWDGKIIIQWPVIQVGKLKHNWSQKYG